MKPFRTNSSKQSTLGPFSENIVVRIVKNGRYYFDDAFEVEKTKSALLFIKEGCYHRGNYFSINKPALITKDRINYSVDNYSHRIDGRSSIFSFSLNLTSKETFYSMYPHYSLFGRPYLKKDYFLIML